MTLSVVLSNYNHARFLPECLDGLTTQTRTPEQVVIVDDGSTDASVEIIQSYAARFPFIQLHRNDTNRGVAYSTERAMSLATCQYLYFASSDDRILPTFIERSMDLLLRHPQAGISCSEPSFFDGDTGRVTPNRMRWSETARYFSPVEFSEVLGGRYLAGNTGILRRAAIDDVGGFPGQLRWHMDWWVNHALAFRFGTCYIPETLTLLRTSPNSMSQRGMNDRVAQTAVLKELFVLLRRPEFRDLLPHFARSQTLTSLGRWVVPAYLDDPANWDPIIQPLFQLPMSQWTIGATSAYQKKEKEIQLDNHLHAAMELAKAAILRGDVESAMSVYKSISQSVPDYLPAREGMLALQARTTRLQAAG